MKIDKMNIDVEDVDMVDVEVEQVEEPTKLTAKERFNEFKVKHPKLVKAAKISGVLTLGGAIGFLLGASIVSVSEYKKWANEPDNCTPMPNESDDIIDIDATVDPISEVSVIEM